MLLSSTTILSLDHHENTHDGSMYGIFTYIWVVFRANVFRFLGGFIPYMDHHENTQWIGFLGKIYTGNPWVLTIKYIFHTWITMKIPMTDPCMLYMDIYGNMDPINIPSMLVYIVYIYTIHGSP